jgi:hypothetical protein
MRIIDVIIHSSVHESTIAEIISDTWEILLEKIVSKEKFLNEEALQIPKNVVALDYKVGEQYIEVQLFDSYDVANGRILDLALSIAKKSHSKTIIPDFTKTAEYIEVLQNGDIYCAYEDLSGSEDLLKLDISSKKGPFRREHFKNNITWNEIDF